MTVFYSAYSDRGWVSQPNLVRSRHRYRGSRESEKFNLEIGQLCYDINKLYEAYDTSDSSLTNNLNVLELGGVVDSSVLTSSGSVLSLLGSIQLAAEIDQLVNRVRALEEGI